MDFFIFNKMIENKLNDINNNDNSLSTYFLLKYTLLTIIVISVIKFYWDRRRLYICALKFSGPTSLPILGNALLFAVQPEGKINSTINNLINFLWFNI